MVICGEMGNVSQYGVYVVFLFILPLSFSPILPSCLQFEKRLFIIRVLETLIDMKQLTGGYMDSKKLEILMTTADLGSFTKASEVVGYTQSGLTHMMNALLSR